MRGDARGFLSEGDAGGVDGGAGAENNAQREREGESGGSSYTCAVYYVIP